MSAIGRMRGRADSSPRVACIGRRISATTPTAIANEAALAMNATLRPKTPATRPPSAAPTASIAPHSEPNITLALACSSGERARLGIAACAAGPTNAPRAEIVHSPM